METGSKRSKVEEREVGKKESALIADRRGTMLEIALNQKGSGRAKVERVVRANGPRVTIQTRVEDKAETRGKARGGVQTMGKEVTKEFAITAD